MTWIYLIKTDKMYYDDYNKFTQMLNITPALTTVEENG